MREFQPDLYITLTIDARRYRFFPHRLIPEGVQQVPREQATTYKLMREEDQTLWALKVLHQDDQERRALYVTNALRSYQHLPGLFAAQRIRLTKALYPELIARYPALEHAILMPWITGTTWAGFMDDPLVCASYTRERALQLALTTARVLWSLETHHIAHTDIAGDNVIVLSTKRVELIDLEGCYLPAIPAPAQRSRGWQGYQHPHLDQRGNYRPDGDRFAGAILLTEMLTWWDSLVRAATPDDFDSLFQLHHQESPATRERRLKIVRHTLRGISPSLCLLFEQAWSSPDLSQCPDFATWTTCLLQILQS